ncbi:hypothetical protein G7Y89_g15322 [Cudoniella acicularis]|uniref:Uncharacterized protein n=1 Tax=Cudoniella acicularis TaxID=354080 RepID=A0A8H4VNL4_9HELO|nr:hypothetical protein G7Y89_g15322 [Cudoniella acicularis]
MAPHKYETRLATKNKEILGTLRFGEERRRKFMVEVDQARFPLGIDPTLPLPFITYDHIQDLVQRPDGPVPIEKVLGIHQELQRRWQGLEPVFARLKPHEWIDLELDGHLGFSNWQYEHFIIQPLFRAVIIIIDKPDPKDAASQIVRLVKTGQQERLSAPITFDKFGQEDKDIVSVALEEAMDFLMELED